MSSGLAVVGTRHGGIPEAVEHGRGGLLVEERDFEALANSMKEIARSSNAFREMGLLGSEFVAEHFEQTAQIRQLERHYDEAVSLARATSPVPVSHETAIRSEFPEHATAK